MKTHKQKCKEAANLLKFGYCDSIIAARTELSERDVEEVRQIAGIFVPLYEDLKKRRMK
jgi:hypothetical protein